MINKIRVYYFALIFVLISLGSYPSFASVEFVYSGEQDNKSFDRLILDLKDHTKDIKNLKFSVLSSNNCDKLIFALLCQLPSKPGLEHLDLSQVSLSNDLIKKLSDYLAGSKLKTLNLIASELTDSSASLLAEGLKKNKSLQELNLGGNLISVAGALSLSESIKENNHLVSLKLGGNPIGNIGLQALCKALEENKSLVFLDLTYSNVSVLEPITDLLKVNNSLQHLNLNYNLIDKKSWQPFTTVLESNSSLVQLELEGCRLPESGLVDLFSGLVKNSTLMSLNLSNNQIASVSSVIEYFKASKNLKSLYLRFNKIKNSDEIIMLATLVAADSTFEVLDLRWNPPVEEELRLELKEKLGKLSQILYFPNR